MATDIIARGMIAEHTDNSDIHVTVNDKENWNSHPNDVTSTGNPVVMDGLQGGVPFSEIVVSGKNLIPYPYHTPSGNTHNGVTFTINDDRTITANGTATAQADYYVKVDLPIKKGRYTLSGCPEGGKVDGKYYYTMQAFGDTLYVSGSGILDTGNGAEIDATEDFIIKRIMIRINKDTVCENLIFRPQLELGSTPTAYEPPITGRELTIHACGKNLTSYPYYDTTKTMNGITFTDNGDGSITVNGRCDTSDATFYMQPITLLPNTDYVLSGCPVSGSLSSYRIQFATNNWSKFFADFGRGVKIRVDEKTTFGQFRIIIPKGTVCDNLVFRPQLEIGSTATAYEPYHGAQYTITPDSNPYSVPDDIRQKDGLNNISVSEGELSVVGARKNAAIKKIWEKLDELTTAVIVSTADLSK